MNTFFGMAVVALLSLSTSPVLAAQQESPCCGGETVVEFSIDGSLHTFYGGGYRHQSIMTADRVAIVHSVGPDGHWLTVGYPDGSRETIKLGDSLK